MTDESILRKPMTTTAALFPDFRAVFDAAPRPLLVVAADAPKYTMLAVNTAHARAFGTTPEALEGSGVFEVFPTDGGDEVDEFVEAIRVSFEEVLRTRTPHQMAVRSFPVARADGSMEARYWAATNAPVFGADGAISHILSAVQDVTGEVLERRNEEMRQLLMREVDHRARNALTVVQSIVRFTSAPDLPGFREILEGRVGSLARAQTSLVARQWEGADLKDVVEGEIVAMAAAGRYVLRGPGALLKATSVQSMAMTVHELATNACKYGALSRAEGLVEVDWVLGEGRLDLAWRESGGPPVTGPSREGFGSRLITQLARQLGGEAEFVWRPEGLVVNLRLGFPDDPRGTTD